MVDFDTRTAQLDDLLGVGRNFDMVGREVSVGGRRARLWVVNGYAEDALIERMIGRLLEAYDMTTEAAVAKLMWIMGQTRDFTEAERLFYTPVARDILYSND